ncbi:branched-chain amino acid transport system II carrier protein [Tenacibaculum sp. Mcav3-52]|uniref:branched-chain amino acid transport system II carrier protein n=1 Tax=Tenacibaculum sp. Mcav3-52 TaxID=2917762 RepID=UPI001EF3C702|nr:branched-chain amino acid transport system II carrier protein [Tenacibaculum sp. Mcav3-52]MCG7500653.1 branched-chain amino acid transport system II carrier protein [Tenacibaculum sp. Mcav3-52]
MHKTKEIFINGFALFSMFFGAGNLILPPFLGKNAGSLWFWVTIGFFITAVIIPMIGILAHAKLQGTMYDFGKKVSPIFSLIYCFVVYTICIALPAPRTASVTHEMAIAPYFSNSSSLVTSTIYFGLVFLFTMNRSKVLNLLGKFLTPLIIIILLAIIFVGFFTAPDMIAPTTLKAPFVDGLLEGYQTFDAIASIVVGGVLVISMNFNTNTTFEEKKELITKAGFIAGIGLLIIYAGLIYNGVLFSSTFSESANRTEILNSLSNQTLGNIGSIFLSVLVALACFTTAVGIITGTADYFKGINNNSQKVFTITAIISCLLGIAVGQFDVKYIINIALPALMFIYPITIVLIVLNVLPEKYTSTLVFKSVVAVTFLFSIPDFLGFIINPNYLVEIKNNIPFANHNLGWILPAILSFVFSNLIKSKKQISTE